MSEVKRLRQAIFDIMECTENHIDTVWFSMTETLRDFCARTLEYDMMTGDPYRAYAEKILNERQKTHGDYDLNANIAQELKTAVRCSPNFGKLAAMQKESVDLICTKLGRILAGDPDVRDHWDDIAGYAKLISERCCK